MGEKAKTKSVSKPPVLPRGAYPSPVETLLLLKVELLKEIDLFRILPQSALENIARETKDIIFKKDEILFEKGFRGKNMFVILSGEVLVYRGIKKVAVLKQGEYLGEMSLVDSKSRSASARALSDTLVMVISEKVFSEYIADNPMPLMSMMRTFSDRLRTDLDVMHGNVKSLSSFTHDMRNCLEPLGIAEALMTEMLDALEGTMEGHKKRKGSEKVRKCFETMLAVRNNLITLIDQNMAIILKTKNQYVKAATDVPQLVKQTVDEIKCHKWIKKKELVFESKVKVRNAFINSLDVKRVLQNLIINAGNVTPEGGKIEVAVEGIGEFIQVSVKDYGCGVPDDVKPLLFKKNYTSKPDGYGLGLMSCKDIISDFHGGRIWFESEVGEGSTFFFSLPYGEEQGIIDSLESEC